MGDRRASAREVSDAPEEAERQGQEVAIIGASEESQGSICPLGASHEKAGQAKADVAASVFRRRG